MKDKQQNHINWQDIPIPPWAIEVGRVPIYSPRGQITYAPQFGVVKGSEVIEGPDKGLGKHSLDRINRRIIDAVENLGRR